MVFVYACTFFLLALVHLHFLRISLILSKEATGEEEEAAAAAAKKKSKERERENEIVI